MCLPQIELADLCVCKSGRLFDLGNRPDEVGQIVDRAAGDAEIVPCALGLDPVVHILRNLHLPEAVFFFQHVASSV